MSNLNSLRRCFEPRQWFTADGEPDPFTVSENEALMWVYRKQSYRFEVGYFAPDGQWFGESSYDTGEAAAARVNYLNGGGRPQA